jgi:16S rRNA (adenine1518-N6/adenine1519-N6)-dimethyltransferase
MKLSEMRECLAREGIRLTRSLGQSFLHDANQLGRMLAMAELSRADKVLEIGPGLGPLTERLLEGAGEVLAIEKDGRLAAVLRRRFAGATVQGAGVPGSKQPDGPTALLRLLQEDALDYLRRERSDWNGWKMVSNLPYSVASPILVELAQGERSPRRIVATLQLEVARRLLAGPGQADYGVLSLLMQLDFEPRGWFKIPAGCFFPEPNVDSGCVCLERRARPLLASGHREVFFRTVKRAFSQRRKQMLKLLKADWGERADEAFTGLGLNAHMRAEQLDLHGFVGLARWLAGPAPEVARRG